MSEICLSAARASGWHCSLPKDHLGLHMAFAGHDLEEPVSFVWGYPDDDQKDIPFKKPEPGRCKAWCTLSKLSGADKSGDHVNFNKYFCSLMEGHRGAHQAYDNHKLAGGTCVRYWNDPAKEQEFNAHL
jgi:hypothetical protein